MFRSRSTQIKGSEKKRLPSRSYFFLRSITAKGPNHWNGEEKVTYRPNGLIWRAAGYNGPSSDKTGRKKVRGDEVARTEDLICQGTSWRQLLLVLNRRREEERNARKNSVPSSMVGGLGRLIKSSKAGNEPWGHGIIENGRAERETGQC